MHEHPNVHDLAGRMLAEHTTGTAPRQAPTQGGYTTGSIGTGAVVTLLLGVTVILLVKHGKMKLGPASLAILLGLSLGATAIGAATLGWLGGTVAGFANNLNR